MSLTPKQQRDLAAFKRRFQIDKWRGLSRGMRGSDFNQRELARGLRVELEHTSSRRIARRIAMDHLVEDKGYYQKLARLEKHRARRRRSRR